MTPDAEFRGATARLHRAKDAVDLLVYCLKYQAYLADLDAATAARLFAGSGVSPPYSDGPAGFEALLSRADLGPITFTSQPAPEAAAGVVSRFGELEACFHKTASTRPVAVRLGRLLALTDAAVALLGVLRREHPRVYAGVISSWQVIGEEGATDAR